MFAARPQKGKERKPSEVAQTVEDINDARPLPRTPGGRGGRSVAQAEPNQTGLLPHREPGQPAPTARDSQWIRFPGWEYAVVSVRLQLSVAEFAQCSVRIRSVGLASPV